AFLVGAVGRDMFTVMLWLILAMIILAAPAAALTAPAITSAWVKAIPTYFFVDALDGVVNRGFTPVDYIDNIAYLAGSAIVSFGLGLTVLRRRVALA
ncbi:MAG: ABC transporter permease, partial [Terriglobia bacterium]